MTRRLFFPMVLLLALLPALHTIAQEDKGMRWLSFEELSEALAQQPKKTLIFFHADWCTYCKKMEREVFTNPEVIDKINAEYYVVHFDVETMDTIRFDGQEFLNSNPTSRKRRGQYHDLAMLLAARDGQLVLPTTLILDEDFFVKQRHFQYLSSKKLLQLLDQ